MININSKIYVAGHRGLVGSAIIRKLNQSGYKKVIVVNKKQLDLTDQSKVYLFLKKKKTRLYPYSSSKSWRNIFK